MEIQSINGGNVGRNSSLQNKGDKDQIDNRKFFKKYACSEVHVIGSPTLCMQRHCPGNPIMSIHGLKMNF